MEWMPIETAPKDGRMVLLGYLDKNGTFGVRGGYWYLIWPNKPEADYAYAWCCPIGKYILDQRATHWAPLPNLPKE